MNNVKSIKQFVEEFKSAFEFDLVNGELIPNGTKVEFKATRFEDGKTGTSSGWIEQPTPRLEISGEDFIRLGNMSVSKKPSQGVVGGLLSIMLRRF